MRQLHVLMAVFASVAAATSLVIPGYLYMRREYVDRTAEQLCVNQHNNTHVLRLFLEEGSKQFERRPPKAGELDNIQNFAEAVRTYLTRSDCTPGGHKPHDPYSILK